MMKKTGVLDLDRYKIGEILPPKNGSIVEQENLIPDDRKDDLPF